MPRSVYVGFAVDKVVLGGLPVSIIPPWLSILIHHLGDKQQAPSWPQLTDTVAYHRYKQQQN
jgi:hypothetical protein